MKKIICLALVATFMTSLVRCSNLNPEINNDSETAQPKSIKKLYEREVIQFAEDSGYEFERSDTSDIASDSGETLGALTGVKISGAISENKGSETTAGVSANNQKSVYNSDIINTGSSSGGDFKIIYIAYSSNEYAEAGVSTFIYNLEDSYYFREKEHYTVADESGENYYKHTFYMNPDDELIDTDYFQYCEFYSIDNTVLILKVNNASVKDEALKKFNSLLEYNK